MTELSLVEKLSGPHEWGYRDPVEGGFIEDNTPFKAAERIMELEAEVARLNEGASMRIVPLEVRPEADFDSHYDMAIQRDPGKDCQNYGVAGNLELGNRIMRIIAPHWNTAVRAAAADDIRHFLGTQLTRMWDDVASFHGKFRLVYSGPPRRLPADLAKFRIKFMQEELDEYAETYGKMGTLDETDDTLDLREKMLDALVDLVYVALGTAYLHGFNFAEAWRRVQRANMAKVRALRESDSKRGSTFDVVKPEGWQPPNHMDLVGVLVEPEEEMPTVQHELF